MGRLSRCRCCLKIFFSFRIAKGAASRPKEEATTAVSALLRRRHLPCTTRCRSCCTRSRPSSRPRRPCRRVRAPGGGAGEEGGRRRKAAAAALVAVAAALLERAPTPGASPRLRRRSLPLLLLLPRRPQRASRRASRRAKRRAATRTKGPPKRERRERPRPGEQRRPWLLSPALLLSLPSPSSRSSAGRGPPLRASPSRARASSWEAADGGKRQQQQQQMPLLPLRRRRC